MHRFLFALALLAACRTKVDPDPDADGFDVDVDCDDYDALTYPGAPELCDGRDNDCDDTADNGAGVTYFTDADGDLYGDDDATVVACAPPAGSALVGGDCDDGDATAHPGATETCTATTDLDCDGSPGLVDQDEDGTPACEDCDDDDADVDAPTVWYVDLDGDGSGSDRVTLAACEAPENFVASSDDCDDLYAGSKPGAIEACDGLDNDCDGDIDDGATGTVTWWQDADGDGFGDPTSDVQACGRPVGYADNDDDCNDQDEAVNPAAVEACTDTADKNCDGSVGQADADGDGTEACKDCDDTRADVEPGATEVCDDVDNDCDGAIDETAPTWYADLDGDGFGGAAFTATQCDAPSGYVATSTDCDDLVASTYPQAPDACDGVDNDCSGSLGFGEVDGDGDGYLLCGGDCADGDKTVHPGAAELCDGKDQDCDGAPDDQPIDGTTWFADADGDGWGNPAQAKAACAQPTGYVAVALDCNDTNAAIHVAAREKCSTVGVDDNCDGKFDDSDAIDGKSWYVDADGDTYGTPSNWVYACTSPGSGYATNGQDCNDGSATIKPGAAETGDGVDQDCDGAIDDGVVWASCRAAKVAWPTAPSGTYRVDPDGNGTIAAFDALCDMETQGGGWTLVSQGVPVTTTGASLCNTAAVGALTLTDTGVGAPAKLADATINALWSTNRELLVKIDHETTTTTRPAWDYVCSIDFKQGQNWVSTAGAQGGSWPLSNLESTQVRCSTGTWPSEYINSVHQPGDANYCGYGFYNSAANQYWIYSAPTSYQGGLCTTASAGRSWMGWGNWGCSATKHWIR